ncbi:hypothetical protein M3Y99_01729200 [Aphelenchoides fujianensis]|nr:hypothetical protein M3Y99_01935700 [Aphelenchoides fujianensis]KAI6218146.1 hypothetical protein M3Y99_01729200 [Aphelenchoides fujianensis]
MSVLSALVADEPPASVASTDTRVPPLRSTTEKSVPASSLEHLLHDAADLQPSALGNAVNNVVIQWNQLVSHMIGDVGHTQPAPDHVKELAEYSVRQIRDACLEVTAEFHRTALEWRQMHPEEALKEDIADYREAVNRQNQLLNQVEQNLDASLQRHQQYTRTS